MERGTEYLRFLYRRLGMFGDRYVFRDPRGHSPRPALHLDSEGEFHARGRFVIVHDYRISKDDAIRFLDVTRDDNPIHIQGDIVPGTMTLSKTLLPLEVLVDDLSVLHVRAKFTGASFYGQRTVNHFFLYPGSKPGEIAVAVNTYQAGRIIAKVEVKATVPGTVEDVSLGTEKAPRENLESLRTYCESLAVAPSHYLEGNRLKRATFPRAFLASLPSGEMVRQLKGKGGILNVLSLDFDTPAYPIAAKNLPEVQVEKGRKGPRMFNRVVTRIIDGIRTYGKGFALVYRESPAQ
ncbi:MAG: hypothetical protein ACYTHM_19445 [Planctomycetota bacterium]|jgi:hypothetical protein